ncbi:hypothetical protein QUW13_02740 [Enterococcus hirae]|nr:hypothetical protein [Enterococcus hirae]
MITTKEATKIATELAKSKGHAAVELGSKNADHWGGECYAFYVIDDESKSLDDVNFEGLPEYIFVDKLSGFAAFERTML